jgi:hypothetical protein
MAGQDDDREAQMGHAKERRLSYPDRSETDNVSERSLRNNWRAYYFILGLYLANVANI